MSCTCIQWKTDAVNQSWVVRRLVLKYLLHKQYFIVNVSTEAFFLDIDLTLTFNIIHFIFNKTLFEKTWKSNGEWGRGELKCPYSVLH